MADQDREITLGTGKLLGFFFGIVVICAFFFTAGFMLGKNSVPATNSAEILPAPVTASTATKPSPAKSAVKPDCSTTPEGCPPAGSNELAFSKNAPDADAPENSAAPAVSGTPAPGSNTSAPAGTVPPEVAKPTPQAAYTVQVAAVSKQQDAEALASALRKKNYTVTITTPVSDNLFHVQVGPFAELKDAEAMRARLLNDGYNPIVKR